MLFCMRCGQDVQIFGEGFCNCSDSNPNEWIVRSYEGEEWVVEYEHDLDLPTNWRAVQA